MLNFAIMKSIQHLLHVAMLCLLASGATSCDFESDDLILDETHGVDYHSGDLYVDDYGNRGIVAYVKRNQCVVVISADEAVLPWGDMGAAVVKTDSVRSGTIYDDQFSLAMLQLMINIGISNFPAQQWCNDKNHGEPYSGSWRLPTNYEMRDMLFKASATSLNKELDKIGGDLIDENALYWTCVEDYPGFDFVKKAPEEFFTYNPKERALPVTPKNKTTADKTNWHKDIEYRVRAIKYVYYERPY